MEAKEVKSNFFGEDTEYLTRIEVSKVLNVTVQTLNNWRR